MRLTREIMDEISAIYGAGAPSAKEEVTRRRALDRLLEEQWDDLGSLDQASILEILGLAPAAFHAVAVFAAFARGDARPNGAGLMVVEPTGLIDALRDMAVPECIARPWIGMRDRSPVLVASYGEAVPNHRLARAIGDALAPLTADGIAMTAGIGRTKRGVTGIKDGFREAAAALDIARATSGSPRVLRYEDVQSELLLRGDPIKAGDAIRAEIAPLLRDDARKSRPNGRRVRKPATTLFATIEVSVEAGWNVTETARLLRVDSKTVRRYWERIETMTGRRLTHPPERHAVELALRAFRLLSPEERERLMADG